MIREGLMAELKFEADNTRKLFDAIPNDVLDYKPNDFNWTIAQLASHTAEIYNWWEETLENNSLEMSTYKYDKGDISDIQNIRKKLEENISKAVSSLDDYPEERFMENWTMTMNGQEFMPPMPRIVVIRSFLMNHLYHHRGELIAYLRACGKPVPGLYGQSYEEKMAMQNSQ